jgi:mannose-6-phosphate isomerase-like protein (cupin superfamily)
MDAVSLEAKFALFSDHWSPKVVAELNDNYVKLAKIKGEFIWHRHENEDEMFFVVKGSLVIKVKDPDERDITLSPGELVVIPRGVEHMPVAKDEVHIMMIEPRTTVNTGDVEDERTQTEVEWI